MHCGKRRIVWHHRSDGSRDEIDEGLGIDLREGVLLGANLGCAIVTNVCDSASTVRAAVCGGACVGGRGIAVLDGVCVVQREGEVLGVFVPHFHNGKCHWVADGEMFPIRIRKLDNIFVRHTYRWKARFVGFLAIYSVLT